MIYKDFQGKKLSALGFGAMRLPTIADALLFVKPQNEKIRKNFHGFYVWTLQHLCRIMTKNKGDCL